MKKQSLVLLLLSAMLIGTMLVSCDKKETNEEKAVSETQVVEEVIPVNDAVLKTNGGPIEFFKSTDTVPGRELYNELLFDKLIVANSALASFKPGLAEKFEISEDGYKITLELRDDAYWQDDVKFGPEDVVFSIKTYLRVPKTGAEGSATFEGLVGGKEYKNGTADEVEGIKVDGNTIVLEFVEPVPVALLALSQWPPIPEHLLKDVDPLKFQQNQFWQYPIGTGPYKIKSVKMNEYLILERFEDYWDKTGTGNIKEIHFLPSDSDAGSNLAINAESGDIDYTYTKTYSDAAAIEKMDNMEVIPVDVNYVRMIWMNKFDFADKKNPLSDLRVRQAVAYAIDMDILNATLYGGSVTIADSLTAAPDWKDEGLNKYSQNIEKAKQLLKDANYDSSQVFKMVYYYNNQETIDLLVAIQSQLKEVGIKIELELITSDIGARLWAPTVNGKSGADWYFAYGALGSLSLENVYKRFTSTFSANSHTPKDTTYDAIYENTKTFNTTDRVNAFKELATYENENVFSIPLYYMPIFVIKSNRLNVGNMVIGPEEHCYDMRVIDWVIE